MDKADVVNVRLNYEQRRKGKSDYSSGSFLGDGTTSHGRFDVDHDRGLYLLISV